MTLFLKSSALCFRPAAFMCNSLIIAPFVVVLLFLLGFTIFFLVADKIMSSCQHILLFLVLAHPWVSLEKTLLEMFKGTPFSFLASLLKLATKLRATGL